MKTPVHAARGTPLTPFSRGTPQLLQRPHLLLVTLLICNAGAAEALPICLDRLVNPAMALVLSVTAVLFMGEIFPQAVCTRYGLAVGYYTAPFVELLIKVCWLLAWPISKALDWVLGHEQQALLRRAQLKALMSLHVDSEGLGGELSAGEVNVITGALDLANKEACHGMTPLENVFMLPSDLILNQNALRQIVESGWSRASAHRRVLSLAVWRF